MYLTNGRGHGIHIGPGDFDVQIDNVAGDNIGGDLIKFASPEPMQAAPVKASVARDVATGAAGQLLGETLKASLLAGWATLKNS